MPAKPHVPFAAARSLAGSSSHTEAAEASSGEPLRRAVRWGLRRELLARRASKRSVQPLPRGL